MGNILRNFRPMENGLLISRIIPKSGWWRLKHKRRILSLQIGYSLMYLNPQTLNGHRTANGLHLSRGMAISLATSTYNISMKKRPSNSLSLATLALTASAGRRMGNSSFSTPGSIAPKTRLREWIWYLFSRFSKRRTLTSSLKKKRIKIKKKKRRNLPRPILQTIPIKTHPIRQRTIRTKTNRTTKMIPRIKRGRISQRKKRLNPSKSSLRRLNSESVFSPTSSSTLRRCAFAPIAKRWFIACQ